MAFSFSLAWIVVLILGFAVSSAVAADGGQMITCGGFDLSVTGKGQVELKVEGQTFMTSPGDGLWSIATEYNDHWPTAWRHGSPDHVERQGDWIIATGKVKTDAGDWHMRDAYIREGEVIRCVRRWEWHGKDIAGHTTLSVRWVVPGATSDARPLMPGICYYGNPSGMRTNPRAVANYTGKPNEELFCEEHRFPMPFVSLEWLNDKQWRGATLHTLPSPVNFGAQKDQWWSLGLVRREEGVELACLSGPVSINTQRGFVKSNQGRNLFIGDNWLDVPPGAVIEKTFYLDAFNVVRQGAGVERPVRESMQIFQPYSAEGMPTFSQILQSKMQMANARWHEGPNSAGFRMYPNRDDYVMGWCGQAEAPGYALLVLQKRLSDRTAASRAIRALNHLCTAPFNATGFQVHYDPTNNRWSDQDPVSQGQAMDLFARAIRFGRHDASIKTAPWEAFLKKACDVHAGRILKDDWKPVSTNEGFLVSPLAQAAVLFNNDLYRKAALKAADVYAARHLDMTEPYWGGTLDANCEDKEGAWAGLQAFMAAYDLSHDPKYLAYAEHALAVTLTYTVVWDIDMPPGRLRDHQIKTRGWTMVSAQNQHLDVFGVMFAPEVYRMGELLKRDDLKRLAVVMYRSCGQLIDPMGSQGEQINHTNFCQIPGMTDDVKSMRGSYSEGWTVFWITGHFLAAGAKFEEMGVDLDKPMRP